MKAINCFLATIFFLLLNGCSGVSDSSRLSLDGENIPGGHEGGGGDLCEMEYRNILAKIEEAQFLAPVRDAVTPELIKAKVTRLQISCVDDVLKLEGKIKTAITYPDQNLTKINSFRWIQGDALTKKALVLHETFVLLGLEHTNDYHLSLRVMPEIELVLSDEGKAQPEIIHYFIQCEASGKNQATDPLSRVKFETLINLQKAVGHSQREKCAVAFGTAADRPLYEVQSSLTNFIVQKDGSKESRTLKFAYDSNDAGCEMKPNPALGGGPSFGAIQIDQRKTGRESSDDKDEVSELMLVLYYTQDSSGFLRWIHSLRYSSF